MNWIIMVFKDKQTIWTTAKSRYESCREHNINCTPITGEAMDVLLNYVSNDGKIYLKCNEDELLKNDTFTLRTRIEKHLLTHHNFTVQ